MGRPGQSPSGATDRTLLELLGEDVFEAEFSDDKGEAYARMALRAEQLPVLHYRPEKAA